MRKESYVPSYPSVCTSTGCTASIGCSKWQAGIEDMQLFEDADKEADNIQQLGYEPCGCAPGPALTRDVRFFVMICTCTVAAEQRKP